MVKLELLFLLLTPTQLFFPLSSLCFCLNGKNNIYKRSHTYNCDHEKHFFFFIVVFTAIFLLFTYLSVYFSF